MDGETKLQFALVYGFRNIQNIVQKIKRRKCPYDFIEIMACPSGTVSVILLWGVTHPLGSYPPSGELSALWEVIPLWSEAVD